MRDQIGGGWDAAIELGKSIGGGKGASSGRGATLFVDQSETMVAAIGSNYVQNYLSGGAVEKGVGILTQKRFYFKGRNFYGTGKDTRTMVEEGVVSLEDITFTKFTHVRNVGALMFGLLLVLAAAILFFFLPHGMRFMAGIALVGAAVSFIVYFVHRRSLFFVAFPGGGFAFNIQWYPISDLRDFQRQLHLWKERGNGGQDA